MSERKVAHTDKCRQGRTSAFPVAGGHAAVDHL